MGGSRLAVPVAIDGTTQCKGSEAILRFDRLYHDGSQKGAHNAIQCRAPELSPSRWTESFFVQAYLKGVENPAQADSTNLGLQVLAIHSGGLVLSRSGDLAGQISRCVADAQRYYEISFDAAEDATSLQYRALQVKLDRAGA